MIITINGKHGSGNTTISKLLAKTLNYKYISIGKIMRKMAKERGITIEELGEIAKKDKTIDEEVDKHQKELHKKDKIVVDSKLGFYFIPKSFKIRLEVDLNEAAERIFKDILKRKRKEEIKIDKETIKKYKQTKNKNEKEKIKKKIISTIKKELKNRYNTNKKRFKKYYNVDINNKKNYDLIIDTTNKTPKEIIEIILRKIKKKKK